MTDITGMLNAVDPEDKDSLDRLLLTIYSDLQRLARRKMSEERPAHTLSATALVHEAYLRLWRSKSQRWEHRGHFFAAAAEAMRRILIESARRKQRVRHGGAAQRSAQSLAELPAVERFEEMMALNDALEALRRCQPQAAQLVELRFFAGLTVDEAAEAMDISPRTAKRLWTYARAWLYHEMYGDSSSPS